jgi:hypothetical protein
MFGQPKKRLYDRLKDSLAKITGLLWAKGADDAVDSRDPGSPVKEDSAARHHAFYSDDYDIMKPIGQSLPAPRLGGPSLVWQLALWPNEENDPQNVRPEETTERRTEFGKGDDKFEVRQEIVTRLNEIDPNKSTSVFGSVAKDVFHKASVKQYYTSINAVDGQLRLLVNKLTELGRPDRRLVDLDRIDPETRGATEDKKFDGTEKFDVLKRESFPFTIWWSDDGPLNGRMPGPDALRIRTQVEVHADFLTIAFYLDVDQVWQSRTPAPAADASAAAREGDSVQRAESTKDGGEEKAGEVHRLPRRAEIKRHFDRVRAICDGRIDSDFVNRQFVDADLDDTSKRELLEASKYLYDEVWNEFCKDFELGDPARLEGIVGKERLLRVFANFRGLVLPSQGSRDCQPKEEVTWDVRSPGKQPFLRFAANNGSDTTTPNEANAVVKAYWPFMQRFTTYAYDKDFIACGVMDWRAIYITPLGAQSDAATQDEARGRSKNDPPERLLEEEPGFSEEVSQPLRYLLLTKGPPNPRQMGKIVHRINTLGTMRHYALKDWYALNNAGEHVRMRGQELDRIIRDWTDGRTYIDYQFNLRQKAKGQTSKGEDIHDVRDEWIAQYTRDIEARLLSIGAALDKIGDGTTGGIHYRISRSRYYVREFMVLLPTLKVGNIETWLSYEQFVKRGLSPAFDYIDNLGDRLDGLRHRLQAVIEGIQTSALVAQASATRENTMELKKIARTASAVWWFAGILTLFGTFLTVLKSIQIILGFDLGMIGNVLIGILVAAFVAAVIRVLWTRPRSWRQ